MKESRQHPQYDEEARQADEDDGQVRETLAARIRIPIINGIALAERRVDAEIDHGMRGKAPGRLISMGYSAITKCTSR